jgi:UDP-glucuronate 4-epimerase
MGGEVKKVVVTGAAGFIGSHLVHALLADSEITVIGIDNLTPSYKGNWSNDRVEGLKELPNFHFLKMDLVDATVNELTSVMRDAYSVIHLAAWPGVRLSQQSPFEYSRMNLTGFTNVLEAVRLARPRQFLFASSSSVYGDLGINGPVKESDANGRDLKSYYAATKWANEILAKSYTSISEVPTIGLRFFTVYGEFGRPDMAYWTFLEKIMSGEPITLYGETGGSRNFTYVRDAVKILVRIIEAEFREFSLFNIAAGEPLQTLEFIRPLANLANQELKIEIVERPEADVEKTWADLTTLTKAIGEIEVTSPDQGISNFFQWYQQRVYK